MKTFEFDWKNFTLAQLEEKLKGTDVNFTKIGVSKLSSNVFWDKRKDDVLTISDYGSGEIHKGSENIYLEIIVYFIEGDGKEIKIRLSSKDDHDMLKAIAKSFVEKMDQGGSTEFWSKETKKHSFFPTGSGFIYFYRGEPVAVVYNIKNEIENFWGVWVPEAKITDVKKLLDQMLNETNSQKGYFISADDLESAVQELKENFNDSFAEGGSPKKYDIYDKIIILTVYDSRIDGLEGAIDYYENNNHRTSGFALNKHSKLESLYRKKEEAEEAKKHFSKHNEIIDLEDSVDAKIFYNELNELPKTNRGRSLFQSGQSGKELYDRLLNLFDRVEAEVESKYPELELYAKGGIVITKIKDIPNLQDRLEQRRVTYRGLGAGKKASDYHKVAGEPVTLIKVDGKEYAITDSEYRQLDWDEEKGAWKGLIKFSAPRRKFEEGGITEDEYNDRLKRAKNEIVEDMLMGELPVSVKTFRELHFYVDANAYGGFFEPGYEMSEGFVFENSIQEALDQWIRTGGHVQMFLAQEALENKYSEGGVTPGRRQELREKLEKLKDIWHDFALMDDSEYLVLDMRSMYSYLSDTPLPSFENLEEGELTDWETFNKAWDEIFLAYDNATDEQIQALIDNHESYIDESLADEEDLDSEEPFEKGGNIPSYSEIKTEYAEGGLIGSEIQKRLDAIFAHAMYRLEPEWNYDPSYNFYSDTSRDFYKTHGGFNKMKRDAVFSIKDVHIEGSQCSGDDKEMIDCETYTIYKALDNDSKILVVHVQHKREKCGLIIQAKIFKNVDSKIDFVSGSGTFVMSSKPKIAESQYYYQTNSFNTRQALPYIIDQITDMFESSKEYAKGGYVRVPGDVKITGIYEFKTKDQVRILMVNGFERHKDDSDSLYLDDEDKNKPEIGSVIVKNSAMRKMAKGNPVTAITSRSNEKGTLTRIKDRW